MKRCENCMFWEIMRNGQYMGSCLNEKNYKVRTVFDYYCALYSQRTSFPMFMQSQVRG